MSLNRWGLAPLLTGVLLLASSSADAGELDQRRVQPQTQSLLTVGNSDLGLDIPSVKDTVPVGDLAQITDFHPETDRWTDRNNRIRITAWTGAWLFSGELDIHSDIVVGFRINWEVPGFIGIGWDSGFVGWSRLEVKANINGIVSSRQMDGVVHSHTLSLGIFNPELSIDGLAFWAGFGGGLWIFDYSEGNELFNGSTITGSWNETAIAGNIFVELDYKITDLIHIGLMFRPHLILADWTDDGRFYDFNGILQSDPTGATPDPTGPPFGSRNEGQFDDMAVITEITFQVSILF